MGTAPLSVQLDQVLLALNCCKPKPDQESQTVPTLLMVFVRMVILVFTRLMKALSLSLSLPLKRVGCSNTEARPKFKPKCILTLTGQKTGLTSSFTTRLIPPRNREENGCTLAQQVPKVVD